MGAYLRQGVVGAYSRSQVEMQSCNHVGCRITANGANVVARDCRVAAGRQGALWLTNAASAQLSGCTLHGGKQDALYADGMQTRVELRGCTLDKAARVTGGATVVVLPPGA